MKARVTNATTIGKRHDTLAPLHDWVPAGRRLVLVDIENLVGGSLVTAGRVADVVAHLRCEIGTSGDDVWTTACGPRLLTTAMNVFTGPVLLGRGPNGADNRLVDCLEPLSVVGRYSSVALASGDSAAFAAPVGQLAELGVPTDVYVGAGAIGASLYRAARSVTALSRHALRRAA